MALQHFRHYVLGQKALLRTEHHSLKWLKTFKQPEGILARWIETLAEYDYDIEHRPGRLHSNADAMSRQTCKQCCGRVAPTYWLRSRVVRTPVLAGELSLFCARLMAGRVTTLWVRRPLSVNQHGQLSQPSLRGRLNE